MGLQTTSPQRPSLSAALPHLPLLRASVAGIMFLLLCFFAFLHCWLNLFAELLRFADRMFYKVRGSAGGGALPLVYYCPSLASTSAPVKDI